MAKKRKGASSETLSEVIVKGMQEKKATDIVVMDLRKVKNAVADFFIVCSGNSDKQIDAIADSIDEQVFKTLKENPWHVEGKNNKEWMLLDYIDVVAHIFRRDRREFFSLERLWGDAEITAVEDEVPTIPVTKTTPDKKTPAKKTPAKKTAAKKSRTK